MTINYQKLTRDQIRLFSQIDRSETVSHIYVMRDGTLKLVEHDFVIPDWSAAEKQERIAKLQELYDRGATFFAAFDGPLLAGLAVLDHHFVKTGKKRLNLAGMWVSCGYRGRSIGRTLFQWAAQEAHKQGAYALYISATPSENTVDFYRNLGCSLANPIDPDLFANEPEDIHLELTLFKTEALVV
jgi:predicted N-acetyltransferase YhbS